MLTAYYYPFEAVENGVILPQPLHVPKQNYFLQSAVLKQEASKAGTFTFTVPLEDDRKIEPLKCWITVVSDNVRLHDANGTLIGAKVIWIGRPIRVERDLYGNRTYTAEGLLGLFNDVICKAKPNPTEYNVRDFIHFLQAALWHEGSIGNPENFRDHTWSVYDNTEIVYPTISVPEGLTLCIPKVEFAGYDESGSAIYKRSVVFDDTVCGRDVYDATGEKTPSKHVENYTFVRYWTKAETAMELLQSRILDSFGGTFQAEVFDPETGTETLTDSLKSGCVRFAYRDPEKWKKTQAQDSSMWRIRTQALEVGSNITDVSTSYTAEDFYTGVAPVMNKNSSGTDSGSSESVETPILPDSAYASDSTNSAPDVFFSAFTMPEDGKIHPSEDKTVVWYAGGFYGGFDPNKEAPISRAFNAALLNRYGSIVKKVEFSFSSENPGDDTKRTAVVDHVLNLTEPKATFSVSAVDLGFVENGVECLQAGWQVQVICKPLEISEWMTIEELELHLDDPTQCRVTLNGSLDSISKIVARG